LFGLTAALVVNICAKAQLTVAAPAMNAAAANQTARLESFLSLRFNVIPPSSAGFHADWHLRSKKVNPGVVNFVFP
jgi:hypothetical protein